MSNVARTVATAASLTTHARDRHCPKCQGAAAQDWLAAREGRSAAGRLFSRSLHAADRDRSDRLPEQGGRLRPACFRAAGRNAAHNRRRPPGISARAIGATTVLHSWGSAMTHHPHVHMIVSGGRDIARRHALGALQARLPAAGASAFPRLFPAALPGGARRRPTRAGRLAFFGKIEGLRHRETFDAHLAPLINGRNGSSTPSRPSPGRKQCLPTSLAIPIASPSRTVGSLLSTSTVVSFRYKDYRRNGQARLPHNDTRRRRVHRALLTPRSAKGVFIASATTGYWPAPAARPTSRAAQGTDGRPNAGGRSAGRRTTQPIRTPRPIIARRAPCCGGPHDHCRGLCARQRTPRPTVRRRRDQDLMR